MPTVSIAAHSPTTPQKARMARPSTGMPADIATEQPGEETQRQEHPRHHPQLVGRVLADRLGAGAQFVLQDQRAFLADVDVVEMPPQARDRFGDLAAVVRLEPFGRLAADLLQRLVLGRDMALQRQAFAADIGDLARADRQRQIFGVVLEPVDGGVDIDHRTAQMIDHQLGDQRDHCPGIARSRAAIEQIAQLVGALLRGAAQRQHAAAVAPQLHRDHVLGRRAGIEVQIAQRGHQHIAFAECARARHVRDQQFGGGLGHPLLPSQPCLEARTGAIEVEPQDLFGPFRSPVLRLVPLDRPRAAGPIDHAAEQQWILGFACVDRAGHRRLMPHRSRAVIAPSP
jgi:hypothetical protein